jgi:SulP family sulfate permease
LLVYALLGTSPVLSVTVTSTIAILTAAAIADVVPGGDVAARERAAATLALLAGLVLAGAGLLRIAGVTAFISTPVLVGFKAGMGLLIASTQLGKVLGVPFTNEGFLRNIREAVRQLDDAHGRTVLLAFGTVLLLLALRRFVPGVPGPLVAVSVGIFAQVAFDVHAHGVALVDEIPAGLPALGLPSLADAGPLFPAALAVALMSSVESISAARSFARPRDPRIRPNREWVALGAANIAASFVRAMPAGGGTSQTAVNTRAEARTRFSGMATAGVVILALTLLAPAFSKMPQATLGAVVLVAAVGLVQPQEFLRIRAVRVRDAALALGAFGAVLFLGALKGILFAVVLSMLTLLVQANRPRISVLARRRGSEDFVPVDPALDGETIAGLRIVRPEGSIYFANADHVHDALLALASEPILVVDARAVPDLEYTGLEMLRTLRRDLEQRGVELWIAGLNPRPRQMLEASAAEEQVRIFATLRDAVEAHEALTRTG